MYMISANFLGKEGVETKSWFFQDLDETLSFLERVKKKAIFAWYQEIQLSNNQKHHHYIGTITKNNINIK